MLALKKMILLQCTAIAIGLFYYPRVRHNEVLGRTMCALRFYRDRVSYRSDENFNDAEDQHHETGNVGQRGVGAY